MQDLNKPAAARKILDKTAPFEVSLAIGAVAAVTAASGRFLVIPNKGWHNVPIKHEIGSSAAIGLPAAIAGSIGYLAVPQWLLIGLI